MTQEDQGQDKKLSGKTDKKADQWNDNKTDFLENPNWLKKVKDKTRHCLERLISMWINKMTKRQISPKIQIDWRRIWERQAWETGWWIRWK